MGIAGNGLHRAAVLAAPLALAAALAACSSSGSTSSTPQGGSSSGPGGTTQPSGGPTGSAGSGPNSCNMITIAEAGAALGGEQVKPPIRGHATVEGGVACVYYGPKVPPGISPDIPVGDTVRVVLVTGAKAKKYFDDYRKRVGAAGQSIPGLGDAAFYDGFASISVLKGDAYLRIAVGIVSPLSAEEALARDALPRM